MKGGWGWKDTERGDAEGERERGGEVGGGGGEN